MVRLLEQPNRLHLIWCSSDRGRAGIKGTAVCLVPVPFERFSQIRRRIRVRLDGTPSPHFLFGLCLVGYLSTTNVLYWAESEWQPVCPWRSRSRSIGRWVFVALAVWAYGGTAAKIAGSITVCMILVSFAVRAMTSRAIDHRVARILCSQDLH